MDGSSPREVTVWLARGVAYLAYAWLVVTQIILVQGFLLLLFGANTGSSYVDWAYRSLERVMAPFRGIFETVELDGNSVLDTSVLFAMVIYGIAAIMVRSLLDWLTYRLHRLERQREMEEAEAAAQVGNPYAAGYPTAAASTPAAPAPNPGPAPLTNPDAAPAAPPSADPQQG